MMKFFTAMTFGITLLLGLVNASETTPMDVPQPTPIGAPSVKSFNSFIVPGNICIVNINGATSTFELSALECLNREHSWFKINSGDYTPTKRQHFNRSGK